MMVDRLVECPICLAPPIQAVLTPCGHVSESLTPSRIWNNHLFSFNAPIQLKPLTTSYNLAACGACLFSTLKTQAIRERRPPNPTGQLPTSGPGMKKPRGKADQEAWFRRFGADPKTGRIRGKILTGSCPVSFSPRGLVLLSGCFVNYKRADLDLDPDLGCSFDVGDTGMSTRY